MNKFKGQNLVEFAIILGVIAILCLIALSLLGKNVNLGYKNSSDKYSTFEPFKFDSPTSNNQQPNINTTVTGGSLGGTPTHPVQQCTNGSCNIDYGDFALTGLPDNFNQFIETSGSAASNALVADLITQISDQLAANGQKQQSQDFKDFANLVHFISSGQKSIENMANSCNQATDSKCLYNNLMAAGNFPVPDNVKSLIPSFDSNQSYYYLSGNINNISQARAAKKYQESTQFANHLSDNPTYALVNIFDKIMSDNTLNPAVKDVSTQLFKQISEIGFNADLPVVKTIIGSETNPVHQYYDPVTGEYLKQQTFSNSNTSVDEFLHPKSSFNTNLRAQLMCVNGHYADTGQACK